MECGDSDSEEDGVEYSRMEQPSLIQMLKKILSEYPCDGQILKELIQNAEDAEASEVKILLDGRHINTEEVDPKKRPFYKFFRSPSLYCYNDALFSETDWEGIKRLHSSVKELDPARIGRYGLGFKSVFHVTDFPLVISGDRMLFIDPHQTDPGKVCQTIRLQNIPRCKKMYVDDCLTAMNDVFGFNRQTLESGYFSGTIFRFSLRTASTKLSSNLYDESKLVDLFYTFECDASSILLFLKHLERLELNTCGLHDRIDQSIKSILTVCIAGKNAKQVTDNRLNYSRRIKSLGAGLPRDDLITCNKVTIRTVLFSPESQTFTTEDKTWMVMDMVHGHMSPILERLSRELSYNPYVGVAAPMNDDSNFLGHVFCFLPLPREHRSMTGLPVHVNGSFALGNNRRYVKWPSSDQKSKYGHPDPQMIWNEVLVEEVLSKAYFYLMGQIIKLSEYYGNSVDMVQMVYRIIPHVDRYIDERWRIILPSLFTNLLTIPFFFTESFGGRWIHLKDAMLYNAQANTVKCVIKKYNKNFVELPEHVMEIIEKYAWEQRYLTPETFSEILLYDRHTSFSYRQCSKKQKYHLLEFLASSKKYKSLLNLELLPLEDNSFQTFSNKNESVFLCTEEEAQIFVAFPENVLKIRLPPDTHRILNDMASKGIYQLRRVRTLDIVDIIKRTISYSGEKRKSCRKLYFSTSTVSIEWVQCIWQYLKDKALDSFKNLYIVPVTTTKSIKLYKLTDPIILESGKCNLGFRAFIPGFKTFIPPEVCSALRKLSVVVLPNIPDCMKRHRDALVDYISNPNPLGVLDVLSKISARENISEHILYFNKHTEPAEREAFVRYLGNEILEVKPEIELLGEIKIFRENQGNGFVSISEVKTIAPAEELPVTFPKKLICGSHYQVELAKYLGAEQLDLSDVLFEMLLFIKRYRDHEIDKLMQYFIINIRRFESRVDIMEIAKGVEFIPTCCGQKKRACALFDPKSDILKSLISDESKFPISPFCNAHNLKALSLLGMKGEGDITAFDIAEVALALDQRYGQSIYCKTGQIQSESLIAFLCSKPMLLDEYIENKSLKNTLNGLNFVPSQIRPDTYPTFMPWFGQQNRLYSPHGMLISNLKNHNLVGATMPLVSEDIPELFANYFDWHHLPPIEMVVEQLKIVTKTYKSEYKPDILPILKDIYSMLDNLENSETFCGDWECIWTGDGFVALDRIIVKKTSDDINVEPYIYSIPNEFQMFTNFFLRIGCREYLNNNILLNILHMVRDFHISRGRSQEDVKRDLNIVLQILNQLKENYISVMKPDILFPINTGNDSFLDLRHANEIYYNDADWLNSFTEDEEHILFVHANVSRDTAEKLGVPSLTHNLLRDTEGIEEWGQSEPLTRRIKNILKEYKDGFAVPKEIIQNAEDAGATKVCFLFDERENLEFRTQLLDINMAECQGPALWAYNDAMFSESDLENITKLSDSFKETDSSKVGKFGLGFCSVYNLTDVPSFISGNDIVVFDPHMKYISNTLKHNKQPGIKINLRSLQNKRLIQKMKHQFHPYQGVFNCDLEDNFCPYPGTLFRFPLRTEAQGKESEIDSKAYTDDEMNKLINIFTEGTGNVLLFTQNIIEINFYHLKKNNNNPRNAELIYAVRRDVSTNIPRHLGIQFSQSPQLSILNDTSKSLHLSVERSEYMKAKSELCIFKITVTIKGLARKLAKCDFETKDTEWIVSWSTGSAESLEFASNSEIKGTLPLAGVATLVSIEGHILTLQKFSSAPYGFYKESHYFCFMPLPIKSSLPMHINAPYAVSSDRRRLESKTSDDKNSFESEWNDSLMSDAIPNAYLLLLENLSKFTITCDADYENLWPVVTQQNDERLTLMCKHFYRQIVLKNRKVFKRDNEWVHFNDCRFLDPSLVDSEIGQIVTNLCTLFEEDYGKKVMNVSKSIIYSFVNLGLFTSEDKILSEIEFFRNIVFSNINSNHFQDNDRNKIVLYALDHTNDTLKNCIQNYECIPTEPKGRLRKPSDLVHPQSRFKNLFNIDDERFIQNNDTDGFCNVRRILTLSGLGMMENIFPSDVVFDLAKRICSITCFGCRMERTNMLLEYINHLKTCDTSLIAKLQQLSFLPLLEKPNEWVFPWKGDEEENEEKVKMISCDTCDDRSFRQRRFLPPSCLYHPQHRDLLGSEVLFVNVEMLPPTCNLTFLSKLGVKGCEKKFDLPVAVVCQQLNKLCRTVNPLRLNKEEANLLNTICQKTYQYFEVVLSSPTTSLEFDSPLQAIKGIIEFPILLLGTEFVRPDQVAVNLSYDCSPHLFSLSLYGLKQCTTFLRAIGVSEHFTMKRVIEVVIKNQEEWKDKKMTENALQLLKRLIELTAETMKREKINHEQLRIIIDRDIGAPKLCLPDQTATLLPITDLCIDDNQTISRSKSMKFVHDTISNQDAKLLGVKSKTKQYLNDHTKKRQFGQKEKLTDRISRILSGYPCDEGILKELLQNADDANASEIHFVTDFRQHSCNKVFNEKWFPLQGPALLVYNDSYFSEKDIEGIQQLGIGSKGDDRTKIGQYGVGFNAVYHLTDAPSFITKGPNVEGGETLCVMDPHCLYTSPENEEDTGVQYIDLNDLRGEYSDVFSAYHEETLLNKTGTIFRFPLRTDTIAQRSKISKKKVDREHVSSLIEKFKASMFDALLFLKNVRKITISDITNNDLKQRYTVEAQISSDDKSKLREFIFHVNNYSQSVASRNITEFPLREIIYNVEIKDSDNHNESWLVIQRIGFENTEDVPRVVVDAYTGGCLHLLPFGGIALPVTLDSCMVLPRKRVHRDACVAFCFLPLPITTGLPFQVNGHFSLDHEARRNLWHEKSDNARSLWNKMVLEMIISPCYCSGLEFLKNEILKYQQTHTQEEILHLLGSYHSLFPKYILAKDNYWNLLIKAIFNKILESEEDVFPSYVYKDSQNSDDTMNITFIPLKRKSEIFSSVYFQAFQTVNIASLLPLEKTFKRLGLRTLNLQPWLIDSMTQAGIHIQAATQEYVIKFLKSYQNEKADYKCKLHIGENGTQIWETNLKNPEALTELVKFCLKRENFETELHGVPLCLTHDLRLRAFSKGQTIFCSEFFQLLPHSRHLFLHANLIKLFKTYYAGHMLSPFTIDAFVEYLNVNLDPQIFRTENTVPYATESAEIPNNTWLMQVWKFLTIQAKKNDVLDRSSIKKFFIEKLGSWCLVPCERLKRSCEQEDVNDCENMLAPVIHIQNLLDVSSFDTSYKSSFEKLQLPYINFSTELSNTCLRIAVPTSRYAFEVLNCLYFHRHIIEKCQLDVADCNNILLYLKNNIKDIYSGVGKTVSVQMIKALKLHVTIQGQRISLEGHRKGLVLPNGIPYEGILQWATASGIELIQEKTELIPLYESLAYDSISIEKFYSQYLLPSFSLLPSQHYLQHISFIKDYILLNSFSELNTKQHLIIINVLKTVPFIKKTNGNFRLVSDFFSPHIALFREMCDDFRLPPEPYSKHEWKHFLECLGIQTKVTNTMFLKFSQTVEDMGTKHISQKQRQISQLLMTELATQIQMAENDFLERICTIRFLLPHHVDGWRKELHPQFKENTLVCFSGSVLQKYEDLVWTSCSLIPNNISKRILDKLRCFKEPPVRNVIQHLKNVCNVLQENCKKFDTENLIDLLAKIYDYLSKYQNENQLQRELRQTPLIFIPDEKKMVTYEKIIIDLQEMDVIKPYLYKAPHVFGRYYHFFEKLGVSRTVGCKTYAVILQNMQSDMHYKEFHNNEKVAIQKVVNGFFLQLYKMNGCLEKEHLGVEKLFLPRQDDLALVESTRLIFSDEHVYQNKIKEPCGLFFFVGFKVLELQGEHTNIEMIDKLPDTVRPHILQEMLNENVRYEILQPNFGYANLLQQFINSKEFVEGFMRVVANVKKASSTKPEVNESILIANLKQIQIFEVSEIVKTYDFQGNTISSKNMQSYYKEEKSSAERTWKFYAETKPEMSISEWIAKIDLRMSKLLIICAGNDSINNGLVCKILQNIENPTNITAMLDDHEAPAYRSSSTIPPRSIFEMPGSFVQPHWHQILDNSFCEFEIGEYVAILVESGYAESDDIYMYAQILKVCNPDLKHTHVQYQVLIGDGQTEKRNAFELYKFNRYAHEISLDVVPALNIKNQTSNETHSSKPLKEIYQEIRKILISAWKSPEKDRNSIVKRLIRRWHPDKNIGNQELTTEVFKYIQLIISKLEKDERVSLDEDEDNSFHRDEHNHPMWSSFFETFASNINSQCNRERRRYEDYSRNTSKRTYTPVPHPREAKRWYSQACFDVRTAKILMAEEDGKIYNWICYTCHQGAEKALKAAMYRIDANSVLRIHKLTTLALNLCCDLQRLAQQMENLTGSYNAMRYPTSYHAIPGEFYNRTIAEQAIPLCEEILEKVHEQL